MDFGPAAADYARHRAGFPSSLFERLQLAGPLLDLGSGTGTLARGFGAKGLEVVAVDISQAMLLAAEGVPQRLVARAEALPLPAATFASAIAGQCWHWFDGEAAAREARRVLRPGGCLTIAHFDYLAREGNVAAATEQLILRHNPRWSWAVSDGRYERWRPHLAAAGFERVASFEYDEGVRYTPEGWRGRIRACNGVLALRDPARIDAFDSELAELLAASYPAELLVPHRVFVLQGWLRTEP